MAELLRKARAALFGESWPEAWARSSARLEAAAVKARASMTDTEASGEDSRA